MQYSISMYLKVNIPWLAHKGGTCGVSCEFISVQCLPFAIFVLDMIYLAALYR